MRIAAIYAEKTDAEFVAFRTEPPLTEDVFNQLKKNVGAGFRARIKYGVDTLFVTTEVFPKDLDYLGQQLVKASEQVEILNDRLVREHQQAIVELCRNLNLPVE
ncbi:MAG: hypothetical protein JWL59_4921 [Chthoniobacteraceae bacterium]|nr:hypothetical protein [Chthoniobacteraceae bacterium]